jgi:glycosyltransferase involved in cell wall biosynthesis
MLHILLVSYEFPPEMATGGIGTYMYHLAGLLHRHGNQVTVFSATILENKMQVIDRGYCKNYLIPSADNEHFRQAVLPVFRDWIKTERVDVMESPEVGACALEIKKAYPDIPLIVKLHTPGVLITRVSNSYQSLFTRLRFIVGALRRGRWDLGHWAKKAKNKECDVEYQICKMADQLISPSGALADWVSRFWDIPLHRIRKVPNPFIFGSELLQLPLAERPKQITFVGKLSVLKGMITLTEAIPLILEQNPGYRICLVGRDEPANGSSMKSYMQKRLNRYRDRIEFAGPLPFDRLINVIGCSQICVFPSLWENFPNVVLEAMAGGAAVVATNRGGVREIIKDGVNGYLCRPKNAKSLAQSVKLLTHNESRRLEMTKAARAEIISLFQSEAFYQAMLTPYCSSAKKLVNAG